MDRFLWVLFLACLVYSISAIGQIAPTTQNIAELMRRQTDTIKKIVSNHSSQTQHHVEYPVVTKFPVGDQNKAKIEAKINTKDIDKLTLEELKSKCQQLARLLNNNRTDTENQSPNIKPRPINAGFYVTAHPTTTTTTTTPIPSLPPPPPPVKYIKLEPIILQKTIMNDGRTIYYWHKSLPSAVQFVAPQSQLTTTTTTTPPPVITTEGSYSFRNFFPSFYSIGANEPASSTTTEKTPTTESTNTADDLLYQQQMRFVVPVPYASPPEEGSIPKRTPWDFDQFAYYPKPLQPESVNVQMPYTPTFHIIKAVAVPNDHEQQPTGPEH